MKMILANPILLAGLWSGIFVGEAFGLVMLVLKHAFGGAAKRCQRAVMKRLGREEEEKEEDEGDGDVLKGAYFTFAVAWPVVNFLLQVHYAFFRIDWSVCDAPEGALDVGDFHVDPESGIKAKYMVVSFFNFAVITNRVVQWIKRHCPLSPSLDIDRTILLTQQLRRRKFGLWLLVGIMAVLLSVLGIISVVFLGATIDDFHNPALEKCSQDEPDLALLYKVNSSFFLGRCVQGFVVAAYVNLACPGEDTTGNPKSKEDPEGQALLKQAKDLDELKRDWQWFA